jgi:hypothetical protein
LERVKGSSTSASPRVIPACPPNAPHLVPDFTPFV